MKNLRPLISFFAGVAILAQSAFAYNEHIESRPKPLYVTQNAGETTLERTLTLAHEHYDVWTVDEAYEDTEAYVIYVDVPVYEWRLVTKPGKYTPPTNPNWSGFFNKKKSEKPAALADAIRGIGITTAEKIVKAGVFNSKPDSWEEFKSVVKGAESKIGDSGLYDRVVQQYGSSNKADLYGTGNQTKKDKDGEWEYVYVGTRTEPRTYLQDVIKYKPVRHESFKYADTTQVRLVVKNSVLVANETESFTLSWDGRNADVRFSNSYNTYAVVKNVQDNFGNYEIELKSTQRKLMPVENTLKINPYSKGGALYMEVTDTHPAASDLRSGNPQVLYKIYQYGWFGAKKLVKQGYTSVQKGNQTVTINLDYRPAKGESYVVEVQLKRFNSMLFSDQFVDNTIKSHDFEG